MFALFCLAVSSAAVPAAGSDWPQLQHDSWHGGHTTDPGPRRNAGKLLWEFDLNRETVGRCAQPVVVGGKAYLGSNTGAMRCFNADDGKVVWEYEAKGPVFHTAGVAEGRVFFADLAGFVHGLDAETGRQLFAFNGGLPGFSAAVVLAEGRIFLGRRDGVFFCVDQKTGKELWRFDAGASIFMTAAHRDGRVFFGSEDMFAHALDAGTGREIWKSEKLYGLGFFWYWPVVHKGRVVLMTMGENTHPNSFKRVDPRGFALWSELKKSLKDARFKRHEPVKYVKENLDHDQAETRQWLEQHPEYQTFYVLDAETGKQPYVASVIPSATNTNLMFPPVVLDDGRLYTPFSGTNLFLCSWHEFSGKFDVETGRIIERLSGGNTRDQTHAYSSGGGNIFVAGDALNTDLERTRGPKMGVRTVRSFNQSGQGSMAIVGKRLFYVESDVLFCYGE